MPPYRHHPPAPALQPVLTAAAMREADRLTIEDYGLPGFTLMETAGRGAADRIEHVFGPLAGRRVTCFCGKGNNGGDGLVVARVLYGRGARVRVVTLTGEDEMSDDAAHNYRLLRQLADAAEDAALTLTTFRGLDAIHAEPAADLYVDALLGTGLTSDLRDPIRGIVDWLNERSVPVAALDVPTGLHSDDGRVLGAAVEAELTVTMAALKAGLLLGEGPRTAGRVDVVEIGIPSHVLARVRQEAGCAVRTTDAAVAAWLPQRSHAAHKYSVGLALLVAGAPGMTGAPVMAATAAARVGAGYATCACAAPIQDVLSVKMTEVTTLALPVSRDGGLDPDGSLEALAGPMEKARALLVGCGLGRAESTQRFVRALLRRTDRPVVIDADGLNALAGHTDLLREHAGGRWVLTPHAGEFARLAGADVDMTDRLRTARTFAARWNCVLVLKGLPAVVGTPDGQAFVAGAGNPALATAGTGDVLAGLCTGLLAQGLPPERAAAAALHLGGAAADRYARHRAARTMVALDLLETLPHVLADLEGGPGALAAAAPGPHHT